MAIHVSTEGFFASSEMIEGEIEQERLVGVYGTPTDKFTPNR